MKLLPVLILLIFLIGCEIHSDIYRDFHYTEGMTNHKLLIMDYGFFNRINDISTRIKLIPYKAVDNHYLPEMIDILEANTTDCKGRAMMAITILFVEFGIKANIILVPTRTVVEGGRITHVAVTYNNKIFDPVSLENELDYKIGYIYDFDDVFSGGIIYK